MPYLNLRHHEHYLAGAERAGKALLEANPLFSSIFENRKTEVRILIVADDRITFKEAEFGLTELLHKTLKPSAMPWEDLEIVTAHRAKADAFGADLRGFRFDEPPDLFSRYDQIWLFGMLRDTDDDGKVLDTLDPTELDAIGEFMNKGGGVFATGDHENLGAAMCGKIPRVKSMRKWLRSPKPKLDTPSRDFADRLDTLREGLDQGFLSNDQGDRFPQEIRPLFKMNRTGDGAEPHFLLRVGGFAITVMPDHMHEGECLIPKDLTEDIKRLDGSTFKEYPPPSDPEEAKRSDRLAPEKVALSTSVGGFVPQGTKNSPPTIPRTFASIVAYDGHAAQKADDKSEIEYVGRVVVDSSFHHFVDTNLRGTGTRTDIKKGLYDEFDQPTNDYLAIKQYYRNIKIWLLPPPKQLSYYMNLLLAVSQLSPLVEEITPKSNPTLRDFISAGEITFATIAERFSLSDATQCAFVAAESLSKSLRNEVESLLHPWSPSFVAPDDSYSLLNFEVVPKIFLGGAILGIAKSAKPKPDTHEFLASNISKDSVSTEVTSATRKLLDQMPRVRETIEGFQARLKSKLET